MARWKLVFLVIMSVFLATCSSPKDQFKYRLGKNEVFIQKPTLLRTDGVYLTKIFTKDTINPYYHFIKFYKNGRCFYSKYLDYRPTSSEFKSTSLNVGERTYFRNKDNKFKIEVYANAYVGYMYEIGVAKKNSITIDRYKVRSFSAEKKYPDFHIRNYKFIELNSQNNVEW